MPLAQSSHPNYTKLKTNLRLAVNRLKLLEKKKSELAQKDRREIADYLAAGKVNLVAFPVFAALSVTVKAFYFSFVSYFHSITV